MSVNLTALDNIKRMAACQQRIRSVYTRHQQDIMGLALLCNKTILEDNVLDFWMNTLLLVVHKKTVLMSRIIF